MDVFSAKKRSAVMARIKGRGNKETEVAFAALLRVSGLTGWRRHHPILGKPDFVFRKTKVAVFVDGCFWHGCRAHSRVPKSNQKFWALKLRKNKARDRQVTRALRQQGWRVVRVWQHDIPKGAKCITRLRECLLEPTSG